MKNELKSISASNDLDYYYKYIGNQNLLFSIIEYFETGARKGFFEPLEFMNLLWEQWNFVVANADKAHSTVTALKALPLKPLQKHILFGFILKMFGGFPVENDIKQLDTTLRLIEKEFLSYTGSTPEKKFCQRDWVQDSRIKQIEKFMNSSINGVDKDNKYDFVKVKEHIKRNISEIPAQILFLTGLQTEYLQNKSEFDFDIGTPFDKQCELEIKKLEKFLKMEQPTSTQPKQVFQLSSKKGSRIDLIRILDAVYELRLIEKIDGQMPTKQEFFEAFGDLLGINLSNYDADLSQSYNKTSTEANVKVFNEMIKNVTNRSLQGK